MLTFTFAGDEAGDVGFGLGRGASRYFVMAVIATSEPDDLRAILEQIRAEADLPAHYEFGFHALTSKSLREDVFGRLSQARFEAWATVADKTRLPDTFRLMSGLEFYLYFVGEAIRLIPSEKRQNSTLILDEFGSASAVRAQLRRVMDVKGIPRRFRHIQVRRSSSEPLIQIADLVAGAILRRDTRNDSGAFERIESKVRNVLQYP